MTTLEAAETPSVLAAYGRAWGKLWEQFGRLLLTFVVFAAFQIPSSFDLGALGGLLIAVYQLVIVGPLSFGLYYVYLVAARGGRVEVSDLFVPLQRSFLNCVMTNVLLSLVFVLSSLPLAVGILMGLVGQSAAFLALCGVLALLPFFLALRLLFVPYIVVEEDVGPVEALRRSWQRTGPVFGQLVIFGVLAIPIALLGLAVLLVGVIVAVMWCALTLAIFYADVSGDEEPVPPPLEA